MMMVTPCALMPDNQRPNAPFVIIFVNEQFIAL